MTTISHILCSNILNFIVDVNCDLTFDLKQLPFTSILLATISCGTANYLPVNGFAFDPAR